MAVNDLAAGAIYGPMTVEQIWAGDQPPKTASAVAAADIAKYQPCALLATGLITPFVVATHAADQFVLAMQACLSGGACQYAWQGVVNDAAITWPAGASLDTYAERHGFFTGSLRVDKLYAST